MTVDLADIAQLFDNVAAALKDEHETEAEQASALLVEYLDVTWPDTQLTINEQHFLTLRHTLQLILQGIEDRTLNTRTISSRLRAAQHNLTLCKQRVGATAPVAPVALVAPTSAVPAAPMSITATTMLDWAARVLPAAERARYGEEFRTELSELADLGAARRAQLAYAVRVVARAWALRRALTKPPQASRAGS